MDGCRRLLQEVLKRKPDLVIRSDHSRMPGAIHVALNDRVVNTIRQVVDPDDLSQVGGFVVADHADVLGHYDREDSLIEGSPYNAGLFHSGAGFGDDEFFKLYRRVAEAILRRRWGFQHRHWTCQGFMADLDAVALGAEAP